MVSINESCIKACQQCFIDCQICLARMAGKQSDNDCPNCCMQCMEACLICIKFLVGGTKFTKEYCLLCAEVCEWCAEQCQQHEHDHCKVCAASCLTCAHECREYAAKSLRQNLSDMNLKKHLIDKGGVQKIRTLIEEPRIVMMATRLNRFPYSARPKTPRYVHPMTIHKIDDSGDLWFFTSKQNSNFEDIQRNKNVQVIYSNEREQKYVSILGKAAYIKDKQKINELWNPFLQSWFEHQDNPDMALLNVGMQNAYYWDCLNSKLIPCFKKLGSNNRRIRSNWEKTPI